MASLVPKEIQGGAVDRFKNTEYTVQKDNITMLKLYDTVIFHLSKGENGQFVLVLDNGGFVTRLTRDRMEQAIKAHGVEGVSVYIKDGKMYAQHKGEEHPLRGAHVILHL